MLTAGNSYQTANQPRSTGARSSAMLFCRDSSQTVALKHDRFLLLQKFADSDRSQRLRSTRSAANDLYGDRGRDSLALNQFFEIFGIAQAESKID